MAVVLSNLYVALRSAGASHETASKAAHEAGGFDAGTGKVERDLKVIKGMLWLTLAMMVTILAKMLI